jgi:hypothetical protein
MPRRYAGQNDQNVEADPRREASDLRLTPPTSISDDQAHQSLQLMGKMSYGRSMMFLDSGVDDPKIKCQPSDAELPRNLTGGGPHAPPQNRFTG